MKVFSTHQLYEADHATKQKQEISSTDLMERAGTQIYNWLHQRLQGAPVPIHVFCGIGNNGGDGMVVARLLIENGYKVKAYIVNYSDTRAKDFLINYDRIKNVTKDWPLLMSSDNQMPQISPQDIIIDALFGIGCNRPLEGWVKKIVQHINAIPCFKLSIDMPSGLTANTSMFDAEAIVKSSHVLTFQAPKLAFFLPSTAQFAPFFEVLDIGLDREYLETTKGIAEVIAKPEAQQFYKRRQKFSHKGTYGHTLIIGGSYGKMGAAILATKAAFRVGAGNVTTFVPEAGYNTIQIAIPEAMVLTDRDTKLLSQIDYDFEPSSMAVGMGIGTSKKTKTALLDLFNKVTCPLVIDADAINCVASDQQIENAIPKNAIFTPHEGELRQLIGEWKDDYDKIEKTKAFSRKHEAIVVIKGANSLVIQGDALYINTTGNPGMATAGSGDVLSGVIAGLVAQQYDVLTATVFGVYLHGSSGNIISQDVSFEAVMASDIANGLGDAFIELFRKEEPIPEGQ